MKTIRFGIIGCGMMGREFASAAARWCHLTEMSGRPEIVAVCNRSPGPLDWFQQNFPAIRQFTNDYKKLLANPAVEAVFIARRSERKNICWARNHSGSIPQPTRISWPS
jgi:predicted dehydrogenase